MSRQVSKRLTARAGRFVLCTQEDTFNCPCELSAICGKFPKKECSN